MNRFQAILEKVHFGPILGPKCQKNIAQFRAKWKFFKKGDNFKCVMLLCYVLCYISLCKELQKMAEPFKRYILKF